MRSRARATTGRGQPPAIAAPALAAAALWALGAAGGVALRLPPSLAWLAGGGVATFLLYGADKWQARRGGWRVPERLLLLLALVGGVAGAWAGMALFRHKTRHAMFFIVNGVATVVHLAFSGWLLTR